MARRLVADVVVVGGGPAGSAAAIELRRAGRCVVLVDKAVFPRDKCCGDGLTAGALRRLEALGLSPDAVPSWQPVDEVWVRSPSGRTIRFPLPDDGLFAAVARRADLDAALLDVARTAGVDVREGHAVTGVDVRPHAVAVDADGLGSITARYVIAADGMWSTVRRLVGSTSAERYLGEWHAFRDYFAAPGADARRLWVWFEPDLLPGYAWSFPLPDGRANVGFGVLRDKGHGRHDLADLWSDLVTRPHIASVLGDGATADGPHRAWPIPARPDSLSAGGGRVLFVGDAARLADPMTGEGIGQALESARLAASAVVAWGALQPVRAATRYEESVARGLGLDNRFAARLSSVLASPRGARASVRIAGTSSWTRRNFARWLFEDEPRAVMATPRRWHRSFLGRPGAYR